MRLLHTAIILGTVFASLVLVAQDNETHPRDSSSKSDEKTVDIKKDVLAAHGFTIDDRSLPMCKITGTQGTCKVQAFVMGEKNVDKAGYTCSKLDKATYVGNCLHGKLTGLSFVIADGSTKLTKEAFVAYFRDGTIVYPALTSFLKPLRNFGMQEKGHAYGCVYFGEWDKSTERCGIFMRVFGADFFRESNAESLANGTFDLNHYRAKFAEYMESK